MDDYTKKFVWFGVSIVVAFILLIAIVIGPKGCSRRVSAWSASAYGSDWLVVHHAQDGSIINYWELRDKSIGNEKESDGIFFIDNDGNVVHLSGHYVYMQTNDLDAATKKYLHGRTSAAR
jgi:hypothetical protein